MTHSKQATHITCSILISIAFAANVAAQTPSIFGTNLIVNGGAELGTGADGNVIVDSIPGWTNNGATVLTYASGYGLSASTINPVGAALNYFSNGDSSSNLTQTVDLSSGSDLIDAGLATFDASGYFGGYGSYDDNATLTINFLDSNGTTLSTISIGAVQSADRYSTQSGLYLRRQLGAVPANTRSALITLSFVMLTSSVNNAYADNLALIVNSPASLPPVFGSNLIQNGDAESSLQLTSNLDFASDIPYWVRSSNFTTDLYGTPGADLDGTSPAPPDAGKLYFYGGPGNPASNAYQDIDLSQGASQIDTGNVTFNLGAWIGGYSSQNDNTVLTLQFFDWSGALLSTTTLGPVFSDERSGVSALLQKTATGSVPAGARRAHVQLDMTRTDGSDDDGLADSLTLVLSPPPQRTVND